MRKTIVAIFAILLLGAASVATASTVGSSDVGDRDQDRVQLHDGSCTEADQDQIRDRGGIRTAYVTVRASRRRRPESATEPTAGEDQADQDRVRDRDRARAMDQTCSPCTDGEPTQTRTQAQVEEPAGDTVRTQTRTQTRVEEPAGRPSRSRPAQPSPKKSRPSRCTTGEGGNSG